MFGTPSQGIFQPQAASWIDESQRGGPAPFGPSHRGGKQAGSAPGAAQSSQSLSGGDITMSRDSTGSSERWPENVLGNLAPPFGLDYRNGLQAGSTPGVAQSSQSRSGGDNAASRDSRGTSESWPESLLNGIQKLERAVTRVELESASLPSTVALLLDNMHQLEEQLPKLQAQMQRLEDQVSALQPTGGGKTILAAPVLTSPEPMSTQEDQHSPLPHQDQSRRRQVRSEQQELRQQRLFLHQKQALGLQQLGLQSHGQQQPQQQHQHQPQQHQTEHQQRQQLQQQQLRLQQAQLQQHLQHPDLPPPQQQHQLWQRLEQCTEQEQQDRQKKEQPPAEHAFPTNGVSSSGGDVGCASGSAPVYTSLQRNGPANSAGSTNHPNGCRPCSFYCYSKGGCHNGAACMFCHMLHQSKNTRRLFKTRTGRSRTHGEYQG